MRSVWNLGLSLSLVCTFWVDAQAPPNSHIKSAPESKGPLVNPIQPQPALAPPAPIPSKIPPPVSLKLQDQSVFTPDGSWIYLPLGAVNPISISLTSGIRTEITLSNTGTSIGFMSYRNGYFWDIRRVVTSEKSTRKDESFLFRFAPQSGASKWENVAKIETEFGIPNYLIPLDRTDCFLAFGPYFGFSKDGETSPVATFKLKENQLLFQGIVGLPFGTRSNIGELQIESRSILNNPGQGNSEPYPLTFNIKRCSIIPPSLRPNLCAPALLPNYLVLAASQSGVMWFFSLKDGQFSRMVDLGGLEPQNLGKLWLLDHFILAAGANKDNQLVVVTRDPDALSFAVAFDPSPGVPDDVKRGARARFAEVSEEMTSIQWWSIDPDTGKKERLQQPSEFPERTFFHQQGQLRFLMGPDGHVYANTLGPWSETLEKLGLQKSATSLITSPGIVKEKTKEKEDKNGNKMEQGDKKTDSADKQHGKLNDPAPEAKAISLEQTNAKTSSSQDKTARK